MAWSGQGGVAGLPVDVGVSLNNVSLQRLNQVLVVAGRVKARLDWLVVVALGLLLSLLLLERAREVDRLSRGLNLNVSLYQHV